MKKQWVMVAVLAAASFGAHAGTVGWDVDGAASLVAGTGADSTLRLTPDRASQSGAAWTKGHFDLASTFADRANVLEVNFSFKVSGHLASSAWGDGFSLMLSSGKPSTFASGTYGLSQFDDGVAFVVDPSAKKGVSIFSADNAATALAAASTKSPNMLDQNGVSAQLKMSYSATYGSWIVELKMKDSAQTGALRSIAIAQISSSTFKDLSDVRLGFGASTSSPKYASFNINYFSAPALIPAVPEPGAAAMGLAGLAVVGAIARRRRFA